MSSKVTLPKADKNKKRRFKDKKIGYDTGYKSKGCPQSKNFRATEKISLDSELFIGGIIFIYSRCPMDLAVYSTMN